MIVSADTTNENYIFICQQCGWNWKEPFSDEVNAPYICPKCLSKDWYKPLRVPTAALTSPTDLLAIYNHLVGRALDEDNLPSTPYDILKRRNEWLIDNDAG